MTAKPSLQDLVDQMNAAAKADDLACRYDPHPRAEGFAVWTDLETGKTDSVTRLSMVRALKTRERLEAQRAATRARLLERR